MPVEFERGSPGKVDSRTLSRKTLSRWTGRSIAPPVTCDVRTVYCPGYLPFQRASQHPAQSRNILLGQVGMTAIKSKMSLELSKS